MTARPFRAALLVAVVGATAACATTDRLPPAQVVRYHLDQPITRGSVAVQPLTPADGGSLAFAPFAAAVQAQLVGLGYTIAPAGTLPDFIALTEIRQDTQMGPPQAPKFSIGLGGGSYSGGRGGGVGLGGGVGFPIGGGGRRAVLLSDLSVTIKRRADQSAVWEGHARGAVDARAPTATAEAQAGRLATALFTGFPGVSGRTIEVK